MNRKRRPLAVTILGWLYIGVGSIGFVAHLTDLLAFQYDAIYIEFTELVAIVCGAFILRGQNWARWLALAWIAFHVVVSAFHAFPELAIHCLFCALIAWFLFRPETTQYFRNVRVEPT
jgi:hypothetical protein